MMRRAVPFSAVLLFSLVSLAVCLQPLALGSTYDKLDKSDECDFCLLVLETVENFGLLNSTLAYAIPYVESFCDDLPQRMQQECDG
jgi:hypothetical protein